MAEDARQVERVVLDDAKRSPDWVQSNRVAALHVAVMEGYLPNWLARSAQWDPAQPVLSDTCRSSYCANVAVALRTAQDGPSPGRVRFMLACDGAVTALPVDVVDRLAPAAPSPVRHYHERPPPGAPMLMFTDAYEDARLMGTNHQFTSGNHEACIVADFSRVPALSADPAGRNLLDRVFGTEQWRQVAGPDDADLPAALARLYADQLRLRGSAYAPWAHALDEADGRYLATVFFATGNIHGCSGFKDALWSANGRLPVRMMGNSRRSMNDVDFDRAALASELRAAFGAGEWVAVDLLDGHLHSDRSDYRQAHLRRRTLHVMERQGLLRVRRPDGARAGSFPGSASVMFHPELLS